MAISGQKTIAAAGTAEPLGSQAVNGALAVKALAANTGLIYLGNDGAGELAPGSGYELAAGEQVVFAYNGHLSSLLLDAEVSGEGVCWILLNN